MYLAACGTCTLRVCCCPLMPVQRAFKTPPSVMFSPPWECAKRIKWVHMGESLCVCVCVCVYKTLGGGATAVPTAVLQSPMMHLGISHSSYDFYLPVLYPLLLSSKRSVTPHTVPLQMKEDAVAIQCPYITLTQRWLIWYALEKYYKINVQRRILKCTLC